MVVVLLGGYACASVRALKLAGPAIWCAICFKNPNRSIGPNIDRSIPAIDRSVQTIDRSIPAIDRSVQTIDRSIPAIDRSVPRIDRSVQTIDRSIDPSNRSIPAINRSQQLLCARKCELTHAQMVLVHVAALRWPAAAGRHLVWCPAPSC